jgi:hypothetical protein
MSERERRLAANEVEFREVNRRVEQQVKQVAGEHVTFNVLCECVSPTCTERIAVTPAEYERIHADSTQFIVVHGHAADAIEDVVGVTDSYEIVRKRGAAADVAREADGA